MYYDDTANNRKLPAEVKEKWLTALRSGNYKQVKAALRKLRSDKEIGHCCLGVLSDVYVEDMLAFDSQCDIGWKKASNFATDKKFELFTGTVTRTGLPTREVNMWANRGTDGWLIYIDEADAKKFNKGRTTQNNVTLYDLNDRGFSFKTIADVIEKYL